MKTLHWMGFVCALTACGGSTEAGSLEETDSGAAADSAAASNDTSSSTPPGDTGEAPVDSDKPATDTGSAPSTDTGAPATDTGGGSSGEAGKINCGPTLKCSLPQICCISFAGSASYKCDSACSGLSAAAKCDGPEDCSGGARCCSGFPSGASCKATCGSDQEMCHVESDCRDGKTCKECTTPGGGPAMRFCVAGGKCPF